MLLSDFGFDFVSPFAVCFPLGAQLHLMSLSNHSPRSTSTYENASRGTSGAREVFIPWLCGMKPTHCVQHVVSIPAFNTGAGPSGGGSALFDFIIDICSNERCE